MKQADNTELIETLLAECAGYVSYLPRGEIEMQTEVHGRRFAGVDPVELAAAYDAWIDRQTEDNPPQKLPFASAIAKLLERSDVDERPAVARARVKARPEVVAAHAEFMRWGMARVGAARVHTHARAVNRDCSDPECSVKDRCEDCVDWAMSECQGCLESAAFRAEVDARLAALPAPAESTGFRDAEVCRCGGTGMVEEQRKSERDPRFCYPCKICNSDSFWNWAGYPAEDRKAAKFARKAS